MGIKLDTKQMAILSKCGLALQSPTVIQACLSTIDRETAKFSAPEPLDWCNEPKKHELKIRYCGTKLEINISCKDDSMYDKIMDSKHTAIGDLETISCQYHIEQVLVNYGISIDIGFNFQCALPDEDLDTLRMLGKIHTEHHSSSNSYTTQSVICER